jgi:histidinol phosphatase-like enzyme
MILKAMADFDIDPVGSVLYGDCDSDIEAARRCGIEGILMDSTIIQGRVL